MPALAAASGHGPVFGAREIRSPDTAGLAKWSRVLAEADPDTATASPRSRALLDKIRNYGELATLVMVNVYVNRVRYVSDQANWGTRDYWATPAEFFARGGDCEDYAIAKYYLLRELGFAPDRLRIVTLWNTRKREFHAVLVYINEGRTRVLDNLTNYVFLDSRFADYRPIYSVNEAGWWVHLNAGL